MDYGSVLQGRVWEVMPWPVLESMGEISVKSFLFFHLFSAVKVCVRMRACAHWGVGCEKKRVREPKLMNSEMEI